METLKKENSITFSEFLNNFKLEISKYQRPYVWSGKQAINLARNLSDFTKGYSNEKNLYYIGTFILVKKNDVYEIIDGQQRIITLLILGRLIDKDAGINNGFKIMSHKSKKNVTSNSGFLKDWKEKNNLCFDFDKINLTYIIADNDDQAFKFYTTLSTSGKPLNGIDIIKPFHLQSIAKDQQEQKARDLEKYQFDDGKLESIVKILLRSRYWQAINFRDFPRENNTSEWKIALENEFVENSSSEGGDDKYIRGNFCNNKFSFPSPNYDLRQPLNKGANSIAFFLYFCEIWERIKDKIDKDILSKLQGLKGIDFNLEYFNASLLTYVSRFGENIIDKEEFVSEAKLIFKVCFYSRLTKPVTKKIVRKEEEKYRLLDKIAYSYEKDDVIRFCKNLYDKNVINDYISKYYNKDGLIKNFVDRMKLNIENRENPFL